MTLKDQIIAELEANRSTALSGQALAEQFGVSRNAVWKAINNLKEEGFDILSTPNLGYRLSPLCDRISYGGIKDLLVQEQLPVFVYESIDSTNNQAKRLLAEGQKEPFVVLAQEQTAGRGRQGRYFYSPKDAGLYMTVALAPGQAVESALGITAYTAVSVTESLRRIVGHTPDIKWVNDLFLDGKKVCGILTEAVTDFESGNVESLLVGIGINLYPAEIPENLQHIVGYVPCASPCKNALAADIIHQLLDFVPGDGSHLSLYRARSLTLGKRVCCKQGTEEFSGTAVAIDANGALVVRAEDGNNRTLRSGEVLLCRR